MGIAGKPVQWLLFSDPLLSAGAISSITSEAGRHVAPPVPDDGNNGNLVPYLSGTPDADTDLYLRLLRAGGLYTASWGWRLDTDAQSNAQLRGIDAPFHVSGSHSPFGATADDGYGAFSVFSTVFNRMVVGKFQTGSIWDVAYCDADTPPGSAWSTTTLTFTNAPRTTTLAQVQAVELADGALLLAEVTGAAAADIDLYMSQDGGLTWTLVAESILFNNNIDTHTDIDSAPFCMARSGDWIRIVWVRTYDRSVCTIVSSDRGATWKEITDLAIDCDDRSYTWDNGVMCLVGVNDKAGTFILWVKQGATTTKETAYTASNDDDWAAHTDLDSDAASDVVHRVTACVTGSYLYLFEWWDSGTNAGMYFRYCRRDEIFSIHLDSTAEYAIAPRYANCCKYGPAQWRATWAGSQIILFGGVDNPDSSHATAGNNVALSLQRWTRQSMPDEADTDVSAGVNTELWHHSWCAAWGTPAGTADSDASTLWTIPRVSTTTVSWTSHQMQMQDAGVANRCWVYRLNLGVGTSYLADASVIGWEAAATAGSTTATEAAAIRCLFDSATAGRTVDVSVRLHPSVWSVYDNIAGSALYTLTGLTNAAVYEGRLIFTKESSTYKCILATAPLTASGMAPAWTNSGELTLQATGGAARTLQYLEFGHLGLTSGCVASTSVWRVMNICDDSARGQWEYANPGSTRGRPCSPGAEYVRDGIYLAWGGGGGFQGDHWDADLGYSYPIEAAFTDSPRLQWRSSTGATQYLVLYAGAANRWELDGIALFGTVDRQIVAEFNATDAWGSPSVVATLQADVATFRVQALSGAEVQIAGTTMPYQGELTGCYATVTAGTTTGFSWPVDWGSDDYLRLRTASVAALTVAVGDTLTVYADHHCKAFAGRRRFAYMRLTFPGDVKTPWDDHRLGAIVAGQTLDLRVPADWRHVFGQQGQVTRRATIGGYSWAWEEGPAQRYVALRLVGDGEELRDDARRCIEHLAGYDLRPLALVQDDEQRIQSSMLVTFDGAVELDQQGWRRRNDTGKLIAVGDLEVKFVEVV